MPPRSNTAARAALVLGCLLPHAAAPAELTVAHAWIRQAPIASLPHAAYVTLTNDGAAPVVIERVTSPLFSRAEWHTTVRADGVTRMRPLSAPRLAPGETLELAPGGTHLMLFEAARALEPGEQVTLSLHFDDATEQAVAAAVRRPGRDQDAHHHHHAAPH